MSMAIQPQLLLYVAHVFFVFEYVLAKMYVLGGVCFAVNIEEPRFVGVLCARTSPRWTRKFPGQAG